MAYKQAPATNIRLRPFEKARIQQLREAMGARTRAGTIHTLLAKGYDAMAQELGLQAIPQEGPCMVPEP